MAGGRRAADRISARVDSGTAELVPDRDRARAFTLVLGGAPQSYVDLDDPTYLEFEYMRRMAMAVDLAAPPERPLGVLHLGGGGLSLPRYVAATRPGSTQRVVEVDGALVEFVRRELPWPRDPRLRVRVADARAALESCRDASYDLVVSDVFAGARTPAHLASVQFARQVARVLAPAGTYLVNVADGPPLAYAKGQVATVRAALAHACLMADSTVLRGRRYGNLVIVAGHAEPPIPALSRRVAGDWFPGRVVYDGELERFTHGAKVVDDVSAQPSTPPPASFWSH
ncbi:spermidine synthase [Phytohabitans kaempferiae]|uniref:Spermidine synthase n=1 Tax=Phytohabitans kaempferiae TaxID=1620943 RepID=A0ABV6M8H7_9ACTN